MFNKKSHSVLDLITSLLLALYSYAYAGSAIKSTISALLNFNMEIGQLAYYILRLSAVILIFIIGVLPVGLLLRDCIKHKPEK